MNGDRFSCKWLATYGLSRGGRTASDSDAYGTRRRAIADDRDRGTRRPVARRSGFLRSGRRKMTGGVLDDRNARRSHLLAKAGLRSECT